MKPNRQNLLDNIIQELRETDPKSAEAAEAAAECMLSVVESHFKTPYDNLALVFTPTNTVKNIEYKGTERRKGREV